MPARLAAAALLVAVGLCEIGISYTDVGKTANT